MIEKTNLANCPDCGKEISKSASSCPHCGCGSALFTNEIKANPTNVIFMLIIIIGAFFFFTWLLGLWSI